jgi:hypothetical protein
MQSLNFLTASSQSFAVGTTGSDFNISSSGSTHTFNLPTASASNRGALSSADWNTFNSKLSTSLTSGQIWIGNASNTASPVNVTGDASINNTGTLTLSNLGTAGTYTKVTVDAKGRVSSGGTLTAADIPAITLGGDVTGASNANTVTRIQNRSVASTAPTNGQVLAWDGSQWAPSSSNDWAIGGNTLAGAGPFVMGVNSSQNLNIVSGGATRIAVNTSGNIQLPNNGLTVSGGAIIGASVSNASTNINFASGNTQYTSNSCGLFNLQNLQDGGAYFFVVKGTTSANCTFTVPAGMTLKYPPDCSPTTGCASTSGRHTLFNIAVAGTDVYVSWTPGY